MTPPMFKVAEVPRLSEELSLCEADIDGVPLPQESLKRANRTPIGIGE